MATPEQMAAFQRFAEAFGRIVNNLTTAEAVIELEREGQDQPQHAIDELYVLADGAINRASDALDHFYLLGIAREFGNEKLALAPTCEFRGASIGMFSMLNNARGWAVAYVLLQMLLEHVSSEKVEAKFDWVLRQLRTDDIETYLGLRHVPVRNPDSESNSAQA